MRTGCLAAHDRAMDTAPPGLQSRAGNTVLRGCARSGSRVERRSAAVVELAGVRKSYGTTTAVRDVDLTIRTGETVALLGPNGAGKSTLVALMLGLLRPDAGRIAVAGRSPAEAVAAGLVSAMLQDTGLMPGVRVGELVRLGASLYPAPYRPAEVLDLAGITALASRRVDRLSGGQMQRVRFALAIVGRPAVLLLDEPTRALDVEGRNEFWGAIRSYAADGHTVLFATHYLDEVDENADRVVVLADGRLVADGRPEEIRAGGGVSVVRFRWADVATETSGTADTADPDDSMVTEDAGAAAGDPVELADAAIVVSTESRGPRRTIVTTDPDELVRRLVTCGRVWNGLEVAPPDLDHSYLELTRSPRGTSSTPPRAAGGRR
jgi:ABC-2 type transport system ATP-binding protein